MRYYRSDSSGSEDQPSRDTAIVERAVLLDVFFAAFPVAALLLVSSLPDSSRSHSPTADRRCTPRSAIGLFSSSMNERLWPTETSWNRCQPVRESVGLRWLPRGRSQRIFSLSKLDMEGDSGETKVGEYWRLDIKVERFSKLFKMMRTVILNLLFILRTHWAYLQLIANKIEEMSVHRG